MLITRTLSCLCFCVVFFVACKRTEQPITATEAKALAEKIEKSVEDKDGKILDELLDGEIFIDKIESYSGKKMNFSDKSGFKKTLKSIGFSREIIKPGQNGLPRYGLVKTYEKNKRMHLLFRLYGDEGINYHDFELVKMDGTIKAADLYIYLTGEDFSKTLATLYNSFKDNSAIADSQSGTLTDIRQAISSGNPKQALSIYENLSSELKKEKTVRLVYVQICSQLDDEEVYNAAIDAYRTAFPDEANIGLVMMDGYINKKEYDKALAAVDQIDSFINKDPFLDFFRGNINILKGDNEQALVHFTKLHKAIPEYEDGFIKLINIQMALEHKDEVEKLLTEYRANRKLKRSSLDELFEAFPEYRSS